MRFHFSDPGVTISPWLKQVILDDAKRAELQRSQMPYNALPART